MADETKPQEGTQTGGSGTTTTPSKPATTPSTGTTGTQTGSTTTGTQTGTQDSSQGTTGQNGSNNQPQETPSASDKREAEEQKQKAEIAMKNYYNSDKYFNIALATIDEDSDEGYTTFNQEKSMKITCFFVPKYKRGEDLVNPENVIKLPYSEVVKEIVLEDKLDSIGMSGYITVENKGGVLEAIFERHNNFWLVINFTEKVSETSSIKYEPYVFEILSVDNISKQFKKDKLVRVNFVDVITSVLSSHSIASFIKHEGTDVTATKNYKLLFEKIINYVKRYLKINCDNYWEFKKDVFYGEGTRFDGYKKLNGFDGDLALDTLVTASFNKIDKNASIYEALQILLKDCVTSIKMSDEMKTIFEEIGDVLIPFFFKEEYADGNLVYSSLWNDGDPKKIAAHEGQEDESSSSSNNSGASSSATTGDNAAGTNNDASSSGQQGTGQTPDKPNTDKPNTDNPQTPTNPQNPTTKMTRDASTPSSGTSSTPSSGTGDGGSGSNNAGSNNAGTNNKPTEGNTDTLQGSGSSASATATTAQAGGTTSSTSGTGDTTSSTSTSADNASETQEAEKKTLLDVKHTSYDNYGGKSITLALRNITMRDFFMPFYLCFTYRDTINELKGPFIWEDINQSEFPISTLNGNFNDNIQSLVFRSIDKKYVDKRWKNAIFLDASSESSGCNCTLVFFDWFYKFYLKAFLNSNAFLNQNQGKVEVKHSLDNITFVSNVIPDFYIFSLLNKVGYAKNSNDTTFNNLFDEYNAYTVALTSKDTLNEALREMGKNIASFVLLNDSYTFNLKGNLLRRPNEIVRLNVGEMASGGDTQLNIFTNLKGDSSLFVYLRKVTHVFSGTEYTNGIVASKICETL